MRRSIVSLVVILVAGTVFGQGALTPSAAPSATMKTLDQIEPRIDLATVEPLFGHDHYIGISGSYYLSSNVSVTNPSGILVNAKNITLDLNGFTVSRASGVGGHGIEISSLATGCTVRNGSIKGFAYGIYGYAENSQFKDLSISECLTCGVYGALYAQVIDCVVFDNFDRGISLWNGSVVSGCVVNNNQGIGISLGSGGMVSGCSSSGNQSDGIRTLDGANISGCNTSGNQGHGMIAGDGANISSCASIDNQGYGILGSAGSVISKCNAYTNNGTYGIYGGRGSLISECSASYNNSKKGIFGSYNSR